MTEPTWPADVRDGALVRITRADAHFTLEGIVRVDADGELVINAAPVRGGSIYTGAYPGDASFTVEVLPAPLPTAEGYYVDKDGDVWRIHFGGGPLKYLGVDDALVGGPRDYAPFTRLVPEVTS